MFKLTPFFLLTLVIPIVAQSAYAGESDIEKISIRGVSGAKNIDTLVNSVTSIEQSQISAQNHVHINELMSQTPAIWISRNNGQESLIAIRSPVLTGAGACGAFMIAEDGIPIRPAGFCNANQLFEVNSEQANQVEVLRGPSSSLYGSNAVHGLINFITPDVFEARSSIMLEAGSNQFKRAKFMLSSNTFQQNDKQDWLIYGNSAKDDGYQQDSGVEQHKLNVIHQYKADNLDIKTAVATTHLNQKSAGFIEGQYSYKNDALRRINEHPDGFRNANATRAYSRWLWTLGNQSSFSITPYIRHSEMEFSQHWIPWNSTEKNSQSSIGGQIQYQQHVKNINYSIGLDTELGFTQLSESQALPFSATIPQGEHYDYKTDSRTVSPWINIDWHISELTKITAGLRFDSDHYDYDNQLTTGTACEVGVENCRFYRPEDERISYQNWSPKLGLIHQWGINQYFYAQLSQGFRSPQSTELFRLQAGQETTNLNPEQLNNVEAGFRGAVNALDYDLTFFTMRKNNYIFQDTLRQNISNGKTEHYGAEFVLKYAVTDNIYTTASGTLAQHKYKNNIQISQQDIIGNYIDTAPKTMGQVSAVWHSDSGHRAELQWQHLAEYFLDPENTATYSGHNLLHANAAFLLKNDITLSVSIRNLTDKKYAERADLSFGSYRYFIGLPRSIYLGIKFDL